ncbi:MAG: ERMES complex subunit [Chrysothrix sp. TS-e1954]|nr:MAG: ERMES complex subunit [Chrysothrix sp. TS-e1954]
MAFTFNWSPLIFDTTRARDLLTTALNKTPKPPIIVSDILVTELNLGSTPPDLDILEIGDLAEDRFRGIFKMTYTGDAFLTLKTKVQANPLNTYLSNKPSFASPRPLAASSGLTIPLQITLSDIRLSGFVILVFSRQKGITLVFRNDPLESLKVSSTFDTIPFVRDYLQKEIEGQLRLLFMEDLPAIIHRLSLRLWVPEHSNANPQQGDAPPSEGQLNSSTVAPDQDTEQPINPLLTPSQKPQPTTSLPSLSTQSDIPSLSLADATSSTPTSSSQNYPSFSHKNLLRLAALSSSHRTLSLFTPPIRDSVYRAWAAASENPTHQRLPTLSRTNSRSNVGLTLASLSHTHHSSSAPVSVSGASDSASLPQHPPSSAFSARPTLIGSTSTTSIAHTASSYSFSGTTHTSKPKRRRKHRVVNLRKQVAPPSPPHPTQPADGEAIERPTTPSSQYTGSYSYGSQPRSEDGQVREGEMQTPPDSPENTARRRDGASPQHLRSDILTASRHEQRPEPTTLPRSTLFAEEANVDAKEDLDRTPRPPKPTRPTILPLSLQHPHSIDKTGKDTPSAAGPTDHGKQGNTSIYPYMPPHAQAFAQQASTPTTTSAAPATTTNPTTDPKSAAGGDQAGGDQASGGQAGGDQAGGGQAGSILNQAWLLKMAKDLAARQRAVQEQQRADEPVLARGKRRGSGEGEGEDELEGRDDAPPAYHA